MPITPRSKNSLPPEDSSACKAFTFVELVVALGIGAMVVVVSVMAYSAITNASPSRRQANVTLSVTNAINFYGSTNTRIAVSEAPSFSAASMAESMRERLIRDVASASAVCCLARNTPNISGLRPTNIAFPTNFNARTIVTPDNFRTNLIDPTQEVYVSYSGATTSTNMSIYILGYSGYATNVTVKAVYESDLVTVTGNPSGVYASVRRYVGTTMTDFYHVFYPGQTNTFSPHAVFFEKDSLGVSGTNSVDRYRKASGRPFYFVWWPDPAREKLASSYPAESLTNSQPRFVYSGMGGATPFFFVIPAFPPL